MIQPDNSAFKGDPILLNLDLDTLALRRGPGCPWAAIHVRGIYGRFDDPAPNRLGGLGGLVCLLAIFAPSFLLVMGALPFWEQLRHNLRMQAAMIGINAAVVGVLLAALYQPVWTSTIHTPLDFAMALVALIALVFWKLPPWLVVAGHGVTGWLLSLAL